jgi:acyl-CoA thioester hydrolase
VARTKINEPESYIYSAGYTIRISDLNYGNHLSNDKVLAIAQEVRMMWLTGMQKSELDFFGVSLIQGDAAIIYLSEGFYADEIDIELGVMDVSSSSFDLVYKMYNVSTNKDLALVKTRMVCYDYNQRKVQPLPEDFKRKIKL